MSNDNLQGLIQHKIVQLKEELEVVELEESNCEKKVNSIPTYFRLKSALKHTKYISLVSFALGSLALVSFLGFGVLEGLVYFIELYLLTGVGMVYHFYTRKKIESNYSEFLSCSETDLNLEGLVYLKEMVDLYSKKHDCLAQINFYEEKLGKVSKKDLESCSIDTCQKIESNLFSNFIMEKVDYSDVHFNNDIGNFVEYKEVPKQFIKKR